MPSALTNFLPPSNFITNSMLQQPCVSGNVVATQSILNGMIASNSIDVTKLQSAVISGTPIAKGAILPGHVLGGLQANRNKIINGDFAIWQRMSGLSFNISNAAATKQNYTADRWSLLCSTGNGIYQVFKEERLHPYDQFNQYVRNPFGYTLKVLCSGTDSTASAGQNLTALHTIIENADLPIFGNERAESLSTVVSFWIRSSKTGNINVFLRPYFTNGNYYAPQNQIASIIALVPIQAVDTWEYKQVALGAPQVWTNLLSQNDPTFYGQNLNLSGVGFGITLQCGNPYQSAGSTNGIVPSTTKPIVLGSSSGISFNTAGDYFYISNVQLEGVPNFSSVASIGYLNTSGTYATPFEAIPYQQQLAKCQRYCFAIQGNTNASVISFGKTQSSNDIYTVRQYPVKMRKLPVFSFPAIASGGVSGQDGVPTTQVITSMTIVNADVDACYLHGVAGGGTWANPSSGLLFFNGSAASAASTLIWDADF